MTTGWSVCKGRSPMHPIETRSESPGSSRCTRLLHLPVLHHAGSELLHLHVAPRRFRVLPRLDAAIAQRCLPRGAASVLRGSGGGWRTERSNRVIRLARRPRPAAEIAIIGLSESRSGDKGAEGEGGNQRLHVCVSKVVVVRRLAIE